MTLGDQQRRFPPLVAKLIEWLYANGYEVTFAQTYRSPVEAEINSLGAAARNAVADLIVSTFPTLAALLRTVTGNGVAKSLHMERLAVDLNLFKDGVFLTQTEDYRAAGDFWKTLDPDCRWGGDFAHPDADHFSLTWEGVQ